MRPTRGHNTMLLCRNEGLAAHQVHVARQAANITRTVGLGRWRVAGLAVTRDNVWSTPAAMPVVHVRSDSAIAVTPMPRRRKWTLERIRQGIVCGYQVGELLRRAACITEDDHASP